MKLLVITQRVDDDDDVLGFFHNWLEKLSRHLEELQVIALHAGTLRLPSNVVVHSLGKEKGDPKWRWGIRFYRRLFRLLPEVDGVFCHMCPEYVLALAPVNAIFRKPVVFWYAHVQVSPLAARAVRRVDTVLTPSRESFTLPATNLAATGHGIDTHWFRPSGDASRKGPLRVLNVNRISRVKEVSTLVEAVSVLVNQKGFRDFRVRIVGGPARPEDSRYLEELRDRAREYGIEEHLEWVGPVRNKDTARFYQEADVFVRMQPGGGYGKNELEALSCGLPVVICAPVYAPVFGRFAPSLIFRERDPVDLAGKLLEVERWSLADRDAYRQLARDYVVQNHNLDTLARRIVDEFQKLVGGDETRALAEARSGNAPR